MYSVFIIIGFYFRKNTKLKAVFLKVMGRPRKGKEINNAEKCRKYREKKVKLSYLQKDKERKQKKRAELKNNPVIQEALREREFGREKQLKLLHQNRYRCTLMIQQQQLLHQHY